MWSVVDHLGTSILMLPCVSKGDREHSTTRPFSIKVNRWVFHCCFGTQVTIDPLNSRIFQSFGTFCYQVIDIIRPVLDGCITHISSVQSENFYNGSVQAVARISWCCTAFYVVDTRSFINDNQGTFELTCIFVVDTEVGLKWNIHFDPFWYIDKGST